MEVRIITSVAQADFSDTEVDVALRTDLGMWPELVSHQLLMEKPILVCSPDYAKGQSVRRLADLRIATLLLVIPRVKQCQHWLASAGLGDIDVESGPRFSTTAAAIEAAVSGVGISITDRNIVEAHLRDGRLVTPFNTEIPGEYGYYLVYPESRADDARVQPFRDWILSEARDGGRT